MSRGAEVDNLLLHANYCIPLSRGPGAVEKTRESRPNCRHNKFLAKT